MSVRWYGRSIFRSFCPAGCSPIGRESISPQLATSNPVDDEEMEGEQDTEAPTLDSYNSTGQLFLELREATLVTTMKALEMTMRPRSRARLTEN